MNAIVRTKPGKLFLFGIVPALLLLAPLITAAPPASQPVHGPIKITLKKDFIEKYKNRATIDVNYTVDKAHPHPNPASKDGDMHVAGRAPEIGLPTVAEIMNAKSQGDAMDRVHEVEGKDMPIKVSGAWRLWCEHGGTGPQIQGEDLEPFETTNPDHVFEIHPIAKIDDISLLESFQPIKGFVTKDAHDAFVNYENIPCEIRPNGDTVTLLTQMAGYNYVEFTIQLGEDPKELEDGTAVLCQVHDLEGELLVRNRRMIFVKGTAPDEKVKGLKKGNRLHVLGLPRIDLALVSWRVQHADDEKFKADKPLTWSLPYEIIIGAVYSDNEAND